ncbi:hypothetical protein EGW08_021966, partial [Elysia chlorotica]
ITNRLRTFHKRAKFSPSNISLAYAGFYYDCTLDITTCYSCGRSFKNWPADSNPWIEHAYYTPMCTHIRMYAGINFNLIGAQSKDDLMVEQNSMLKTKLMCVVCYTNERDILLLPCCHLVTCYKCTSQITLCPICRKQFTNLTKVFR